jgi:transposase
MKIDLGETRVFIRPGTTDMRKAINGLSCIAESIMDLSPLTGNLFLFCGKTRRILKAIYWDRNGFWLLQKRLERDRFPWPETQERVRELNEGELRMLLDGIDFFHMHRAISYEKTG